MAAETISTYNNLGDTIRPILETYQVERGVFIPNKNKNQIDSIIPYGYHLMGITLLSSVGSASWAFKHRESKVAKASQPEILYLICVGCVTSWDLPFYLSQY